MTAPAIKETYVYRVSLEEKDLFCQQEGSRAELRESWRKTITDMLASKQAQASFPVTYNVCFPNSDDIILSLTGEPKKDWTSE